MTYQEKLEALNAFFALKKDSYAFDPHHWLAPPLCIVPTNDGSKFVACKIGTSVHFLEELEADTVFTKYHFDAKYFAATPDEAIDAWRDGSNELLPDEKQIPSFEEMALLVAVAGASK